MSDSSDIFISDRYQNRVLVFNCYGDPKYFFKCLVKIEDIYASPEGYLVVAVHRAGSNIIKCYTFEGQILFSLGESFRYERSHGVALTKGGKFLVTSTLNHCVIVLHSDGKQAYTFGKRGLKRNHFNNPHYVTVNNTNEDVIISDSGNNCIKVFSITGEFQFKFGQEGTEPGRLKNPMGICVDHDGNIIVGDSGNHRLQLFSSKGKYKACLAEFESWVEIRKVAMGGSDTIMVLVKGEGYSEVILLPYSVMQNSTICAIV